MVPFPCQAFLLLGNVVDGVVVVLRIIRSLGSLAKRSLAGKRARCLTGISQGPKVFEWYGEPPRLRRRHWTGTIRSEDAISTLSGLGKPNLPEKELG